MSLQGRPVMVAVCLGLGAWALVAGLPVVRAASVQNSQQISSDTLPGSVGGEHGTQAEPSIALDPRAPNVFVTLFQVRRFEDGGSAAIGYAASHDGGMTWTRGILPQLTRASGGGFPRASNATVAFGPDGAVYAATLPLALSHRACTPASRTAVAVQRSADGGAHVRRAGARAGRPRRL